MCHHELGAQAGTTKAHKNIDSSKSNYEIDSTFH